MRTKPTAMARSADSPAKMRMAHSPPREVELLVAAFGGEY